MSTPADLGRFMEALLGGEPLEPAQLAEMRKIVQAPDFDASPAGATASVSSRHR